jgi:hypothetical protein
VADAVNFLQKTYSNTMSAEFCYLEVYVLQRVIHLDMGKSTTYKNNAANGTCLVIMPVDKTWWFFYLLSLYTCSL